MAQKARKDRAKSNSAALNNLHIGSLIVNSLFLLSHSVFRTRSLLLWFILSLPSFVCQFALERTGRPRYDPTTKALKSSGEDLGAAGLTEYMFDVIWVTWGAAILVALFGNWAWLLWAVVPAYGVYKGFGMMGAAKQMAQMGADANPAPAGNRKQRRAA
ncbi:Meiotically up-regulated gene 69 protein [Madurella mycetomatis]|uniref:Meiotically up-regulated gene 69 protein n=1 Tax=Madurella mycetomatis TaxID=100816 RepID=A0A175VQ18_9PEZI|nr:Meiotically up-regulated gene 69 protein [Madurella mycetomatis]